MEMLKWTCTTPFSWYDISSASLLLVLRAHRQPQTQAQVLDASSLMHLVPQDPRIIVFLQRLATVDRHSFFNNGGWSGVSPPALATIAHLLVRLHIFDHFLDALAFPRQATLPTLRTIPFPYEFPERVRRVGLFHFLLHFLADFYLGGSRTPSNVDASDHPTPTHHRYLSTSFQEEVEGNLGRQPH
jgi:hypothetical protein